MACTTVPYNICVEQGADLSIPITVNGLILTGATAEMDIREAVTSPTVFMTLSTDNGKISIVDNLITLSLTALETATFTRPYVYDLFVTTQDTKKYKLLKGRVVVDPSVTR